MPGRGATKPVGAPGVTTKWHGGVFKSHKGFTKKAEQMVLDSNVYGDVVLLYMVFNRLTS